MLLVDVSFPIASSIFRDTATVDAKQKIDRYCKMLPLLSTYLTKKIVIVEAR